MDFDSGLGTDKPETPDLSPRCPTCGIGTPIRKRHTTCVVCNGKTKEEIEALKARKLTSVHHKEKVGLIYFIVGVFIFIFGIYFLVNKYA